MNKIELDRKINNLENCFESVTLQLEKLEISRDMFIDLEVSTSKNYDSEINSIEDRIHDFEDKQYEIQCLIEEFDNV